jgi:hypothetical protein
MNKMEAGYEINVGLLTEDEDAMDLRFASEDVASKTITIRVDTSEENLSSEVSKSSALAFARAIIATWGDNGR